MKIFLTTLFILILNTSLHAQNEDGKSGAVISFNSYVSSGKELPFWLRSNQNGAFETANSTTQLIRAGYSRFFDRESDKSWDFTFGAVGVAGLAKEAYFQPNQYWVGARYNWLVLKAGAEAEPIRFGGLSSTNGNLDLSNNARPVPKVAVSTNDYISWPFKKGIFSWKALYSEGMLWDNSYIKEAHLHHKNLYFKIGLSKGWQIVGGGEHFVFWGGNSPTLGKMPGFSEYLRYIMGRKGGESATSNDQINVAGNQLGSYNLEIKKQWKELQISLYWSHPFEDRSGIELVNIQDGLWGIHWETSKKSSCLTEILYEWMYTLNQSGNPLISQIRGGDGYFNHSEYRSGYTHYAQMMGTPLFVPNVDPEGVSFGFESNRMWMHHFGLKGFFANNVGWKTMLTYSRNFGQYRNVYPSPLSECSVLGELNYKLPKLPIMFNAALSGDFGDRFEKRVGGYVGLKWAVQ